LTDSASASRGNVDGEGTTQVNSHVSAGDRLTISRGGDTNLKGAVASANQVVADVKGNLNIESLQDASTLDGKRQSASVSGTVGAGAGFSASISQSKVHNDFASVQEQSGIRAGDGGFQVQVAGNTDLKGGVISSSEQVGLRCMRHWGRWAEGSRERWVRVRARQRRRPLANCKTPCRIGWSMPG
jgi:filamentous hemagglutinin